MQPERITFRAPKGWSKKIDSIAQREFLKDRSALLRRDLQERHPELRKEVKE
jgi:hypothetical protein